LRLPLSTTRGTAKSSTLKAKCAARETMEIALEAAETGQLVLSTVHTIDASRTVERIIGVFPLSDQQAIRTRVGKAFRFIISQRLLPRKDAQGGIAAIEVLQSTMRTRDYVEKGEGERKTLLDVMHDGDTEEMLHLDGEIAWVIRPIAICGSRLRILLRIRKAQAVPLRSKSSGSTLWETEAQKKNLHPPALAIYLVSALS
jgi:Tfp pilus assembly ATPase PilU